MTNESIETAGGKLEFHRRGPVAGQSAGTVILLHPWFGCWQFWNRTIDALPEFDTISVDLYSLGDRTDWREFAGPDGLATAVGGLLDASHIDRCCVIGNSMGGIAAQALAASHTGRVEKIILVGTGARIFGVKLTGARPWTIGSLGRPTENSPHVWLAPCWHGARTTRANSNFS
jgi:pimeloyl-ACP methyl ester carboxylesterase